MNHKSKQRILRNLLAVGCVAPTLSGMSTMARADEKDTQQWTLVTVQKELSDKWRFYGEIQPRFGPDLTGGSGRGVERILNRTAIGYRLNKKVSVWQGYAWTPQFKPTDLNEHRLFQQLLYEDRFGKTGFINRARLEERFIEDAGGTSFRLRNMVRVAHPISADRKWTAVAYDELFWNLNSTDRGPKSGYDQNRIFLGVSKQTNSKLRVETGYLYAHFNRPRAASDRQVHAWVVQLAFTP
ncbi:DUF2490 domain-containing protein [bacterium]|nr:MAG: DUF2490 domain-containing protein [bacterium]